MNNELAKYLPNSLGTKKQKDCYSIEEKGDSAVLSVFTQEECPRCKGTGHENKFISFNSFFEAETVFDKAMQMFIPPEDFYKMKAEEYESLSTCNKCDGKGAVPKNIKELTLPKSTFDRLTTENPTAITDILQRLKLDLTTTTELSETDTTDELSININRRATTRLTRLHQA